MTALQFEATYGGEWAELEALLETTRLGPGPGASLASGIDDSYDRARLAALYRRACGHQALAIGRAYPAHIIDRLQRLTMAGHQLIYQSRKVSWRRMLEAAAVAVPRAVRQHWRYVALAAIVFAGPMLVMGLLVWWRSDLILSMVSPETAASFEEMYSTANESIGRTREAATDWMMFGFYIRNNVGIAFQCYASGLFAGLGSLFYLAFNGAFAGAIGGYVVDRGLSTTFFSFVATHSAFELTAIVLSGAAGLRVGHGLIAPGRLTRTASLVVAARESVTIVYGAAVLLLLAAAVEAFWSSARWVPLPLKYSVAAICWTAVIAYLSMTGRRRAH